MRYGEIGKEHPALLLDGNTVDSRNICNDYDESFFSHDGISSLTSWLDDGCVGGAEITNFTRIATPITRPSKIVCVGKNYAKHAKEFGGEVPNEPVLFMKASSSFSGPFDDVIIPMGSKHLDYEVELAVVISKTAKNIVEEDAELYIAGYSIIADYSEREFQKHRSGQWTKGKSADTFAPMGPYLLTPDEIANVDQLHIWTKVNGELRQDAMTSDMMFKVPFLVSYISQFMTLLPGDVIATGTPSGVGMAMNPPQYLKTGDFVEMGIDGLGVMKQRIV